MTDATNKSRTIICIGDIHGYHNKLLNLWSNLQSQIDPECFNTATVIFLGDYCDRGPDTRKVMDFLISLPKQYPNQKHVFLSGNHDFAFAGFVGVLPGEFEAKDTWQEYLDIEEREGWYKGEGYEKMHLQGGDGLILIMAVLNDHKKFLADMLLETECDQNVLNALTGKLQKSKLVSTSLVSWNNNVQRKDLKHCKLIAVHAGLERGKNVQEQLEFLKARDSRVPKVTDLSGRKDVWDIPKELTETIVVSGHHGKLHIEGLRLIIDEGGGMESNPVAAIVLPSMKIVRDTDNFS
ncbi:uncharacterized protein LOC111310592 [Durio zibethinus]|uniref:Uncharacterized protein LOC111310592 n=1 Tax=Durio zibethinus TaxID=66656 RepID=A0A6P6ALT5_DURZI|nr:uncharacterized protein LOC111310592 [Durio zibethinus]